MRNKSKDAMPVTGSLPSVDLGALIDRSPLGSLQIRAILLCAALFAVDGFDMQSIAFSIPAIAGDWGVAPAAFGLALGTTVLGFAVGSAIFGSMADRFGRRPMLLVTAVLFGVFTLGAATSGNILELSCWRALAGIGLGGAIPNLIALTAELSPARQRTKLVTFVSCGYTIGGATAGIASAWILPLTGWQGMFLLGGIAPLLLLPLLWRVLPESPRFLVHQGRQEAAYRLAAMIAPHEVEGRSLLFVPGPDHGPHSGKGRVIASLFGEGRWPATLLLWALFLMSIMVAYLLASWTPSLMAHGGGVASGAAAGVALQVGATCGIALPWLADRIGISRIILICYGLAGSLLLVFSTGAAPPLAAICLLGLLVLGVTFIVNALASTLYPTAARSTGVGWAMGVGRTGSLIGATFGGSLIGSTGNGEHFFLVAAALCLGAAGAAGTLSFVLGKTGGKG